MRFNIVRFRRSLPAVVLAVGAMSLCSASAVRADGLDRMTGCWATRGAVPTSLLSDARDLKSHRLIFEKSLLIFDRIAGTRHLVIGRLYEWDKKPTYVLGPTYQHGAFDPIAKTLTFSFPHGGIDAVHRQADGSLLYVHKKAAATSAMSVRPMFRLDCAAARKLEQRLLSQQKSIGKKKGR